MVELKPFALSVVVEEVPWIADLTVFNRCVGKLDTAFESNEAVGSLDLYAPVVEDVTKSIELGVLTVSL